MSVDVQLSKDQNSGSSEWMVQLPLAPEFSDLKPKRLSERRHPVAVAPTGEDPMELLYEERLAAQSARRTPGTYRWLRRDVVRTASDLAGRRLTLSDLFRDERRLGEALVRDHGRSHGGTVSKSTIAHRRTAIRSVARLLGPELRMALGDDPLAIVNRALRGVAEHRGSGFRILRGTPRSRGGETPNEQEIQLIFDMLGRGPDWSSSRDQAFFVAMGDSAARVNSLRTIDCSDVAVLSGGRVRLLLHQKNGSKRHETELSVGAARALQLYVAEYNLAMERGGRSERVVLGEPGALWRDERGRQWPETRMRRTLRGACDLAGTADYTPHVFRRAWATRAAESLPRWEAAHAGGWRGTERFDAHYVSTSRQKVWHQLGRLAAMTEATGTEASKVEEHAAFAI